MADVYSNAYLVLAHSSTWDSTYSVLEQREPIRSLRLFGENSHIHLRCTEDENLQKFFDGLNAGQYHPEEYRRSFPITTTILATLASRGWTLQERLLARRAIFFTPCQLAWQCRSYKLIESSTEPESYYDRIDLVPDHYATQDAALEAWKKVTEIYSSLDLTYNTDKLIALAGLAQRFEALIYDTYIAGLWRSFLPELLAWIPEGESNTTRSKTYRAPSWSWASLDGPIIPFYGPALFSTRRLRILSAYVETVDDDEFGPVKDAWLHVKGYCMPVLETLNMQFRDAVRKKRRPKAGTVAHMSEPWRFLLPNSVEKLHAPDVDWDTHDARELWEHQGVGNRGSGVDLSLLVLQLTRSVDYWDVPSVFCLLLVEVYGRVNTYRRVGRARIVRREEEKHHWEETELILI